MQSDRSAGSSTDIAQPHTVASALLEVEEEAEADAVLPAEYEMCDDEVEANEIWYLTKGEVALPEDFLQQMAQQDPAHILLQGLRQMSSLATQSFTSPASTTGGPIVSPASMQYFRQVASLTEEVELSAEDSLTRRGFIASLEQLESVYAPEEWPAPEPVVAGCDPEHASRVADCVLSGTLAPAPAVSEIQHHSFPPEPPLLSASYGPAKKRRKRELSTVQGPLRPLLPIPEEEEMEVGLEEPAEDEGTEQRGLEAPAPEEETDPLPRDRARFSEHVYRGPLRSAPVRRPRTSFIEREQNRRSKAHHRHHRSRRYRRGRGKQGSRRATWPKAEGPLLMNDLLDQLKRDETEAPELVDIILDEIRRDEIRREDEAVEEAERLRAMDAEMAREGARKPWWLIHREAKRRRHNS